MAVRHYTKEQLVHLRESPLVQKPEDLPAIEQWLEYVYADQESREKLRIPHSESQHQSKDNATARRQAQQGNKTGAESPMGNFSAGARPSLVGRTSTRGDDVSLGPPRTMFPSSRNVSKLSDFTGEKGEEPKEEEQETVKARVFGDKANRKSGTEKDSWTTVREKRQAGEEGPKHESRYIRRDREQDGERRNGHGEKGESKWGERRQNGDRTSWRDREREKGRGWEREERTEKAPEWMGDPAPPGGEDDLRTMGMPRNQEQFQKWKEAMSGKKPVVEEPGPIELPFAKEPAPAKATAPLKLEGIVDKPFGGWADPKTASAGALEGATASAKSAQSKGKASRFASMFKDVQPRDGPPAPVPKPSLDKANGSAEDVAGFNRILQMLGGNDNAQSPGQDGPASPPPTRGAADGTKPKSRFTGFFDQTPKSPEMQSLPEAPLLGNGRNTFSNSRNVVEEPPSMFGSRLPDTQPSEQAMREQIRSNPMSPVLMQPTNPPRDQQQQQQPPHQRMNDLFLDQPPSRNTASPDVNIQNLLAAQRAQRTQGQDKNSEFLLNLLQTKGSARPLAQHPRQDPNFPIWLDQTAGVPDTHAPKPRAPPPGMYEDQLMRSAPQDAPRQERLHQMPISEMHQPRASQRAPPGFYDEQSLFLQQQQQMQQQQAAAQHRRAFAEQQQQQQQQQQQIQQQVHHHQNQAGARRMSGHPQLAQMQIPNQHFQQGPQQQHLPDFIQSPTGVPGPQGPPPGFHPQMPRHPPGLHNTPNIFQAPQQSQQQMPLNRDPPGFAGMQSHPTQLHSPPGAPPGFHGGMPPGFAGMQMRSPVEGMSAGGMRGGRPFDGAYDGMQGLNGGQMGPRR